MTTFACFLVALICLMSSMKKYLNIEIIQCNLKAALNAQIMYVKCT